METTVNVNPPRKGWKKTLLILGVAGIALVGGLGTAYAKFDLFKSPKMIYLEAEAKSFTELSAHAADLVSEYESYMKPYLETPVHTTMEITDIHVDAALPDPQAQNVLELVKGAKLVVDSGSDQQKQQQFTKTELFVKDKKLIGMELFMDQNRIGFGVPDLYHKYGVIDLKDRDVLKEKYGMEGLPKRFVTYNDMYNAVKFSKEEVSGIAKEYALLYVNNLKDSQVTLKKDISFSEQGYQTKARELTITFTAEELKTLLTQFAEKAKADEKLFDLIYTRYQNIAKLLIDSGYSDVKEMTKEEFRQEYTKGFDDMIADLKTGQEKGGLKMVLLVNSDDQILSRKLLALDEQGKEKPGSLQYISFTNGTNTVHRFSLQSDENGEKGEMTISYHANKQNEKTTGSFAVLFKSSGNGQEKERVDLTTKFSTTKLADKEEGTYEFTFKGKGDTDPQTFSFSGTVTASATMSDSVRDSQYDIKVNFDPATPDMPKSLALKVKAKEEFGKEVTLPSLTADNSVNLATLTDDDMMKLEQDLGTAAQQYMVSNMQLFQELGIMPPGQ
jgi:hypothetical protein